MIMASPIILLSNYDSSWLVLSHCYPAVTESTIASLILLLSDHYCTVNAIVSKECSKKDQFHYSSTTIECIVDGTYHSIKNYSSKQSV